MSQDINRWLMDLSASPRSRFWKVAFNELTPPERVFVAVWELEAEVNNGGFKQYYQNTSGDNACHAVAALLAIRADRAADIVKRANAVFGGEGPSPDEGIRLSDVGMLSIAAQNTLSALDSEFMTYPDNLTDLLYRYVQTHKDDIAGS